MIFSLALSLITMWIPARATAEAAPPPRLIVQTAPAGRITDLAYSPDGQFLVSLSDDGAVRVWQAKGALLLAAYAAGPKALRGVAVAGANDLVAFGADRQLVVWDWRQSAVRWEAPLQGRYAALAFSSDGQSLWYADSRGLCVRDVHEAAAAPHCHAATDITRILALGPGRIVTGDANGRVVQWSGVDDDGQTPLWTHPGYVSDLVAIDGGKTLIAAGNGSVSRFDLVTGRPAAPVYVGAAANLARLSPDGRYAAAGTSALVSTVNSIIITDWADPNQHTVSVPAQTQPVTALAFSPDGAFLASGGWDSDIHVWLFPACARGAPPPAVLTRPCQEWIAFKPPPSVEPVKSLAVSPSGSRVAIGTAYALSLFDLGAGDLYFRVTPEPRWPTALRFSGDSQALASVARPAAISVWSAISGAELQHATVPHQSESGELQLEYDGRAKAFVAASDTGLFRWAWPAWTRRTLDSAGAAAQPPQGLAISHDGTLRLQSGPQDAVLVDARLGRPQRWLQGPWAVFPAFSADGRMLAGVHEAPAPATAAATDPDPAPLQQVQLIDLARPGPTRAAPVAGATAIIVSADATALMLGDDRGRVSLFDPVSLKQTAGWQAHTGAVTGIGDIVRRNLTVTTGDDGALKIWSRIDHSLLVTLVVFDGGDWLAFSPEGFFDGTRRAWRLARVLFPDQPDRLYAPEQFFLQFYQPGLISDVAQAGKSELSVLRDRRDPRARLDVGLLKTTRPPTVDLQNPAINGAVATLDLVAIGAGSGVKDCRLSRNGVVVQTFADEAQGDAKLRLTATVHLQPGGNALMGYCFNSYGSKSADMRLDLKGPNRPFAIRSGRPELLPVGMAYVLAVGIGDYHGYFPTLAYGAADARTVATALEPALTGTGQFLAVKSTVLTDADASREAILAALAILSGQRPVDPVRFPNLARLGPNDSLVVYYAGHGETPAGAFAMLTYQDGPRHGLGEVITAQDLRDALEPEEAAHVLLILDTCTSGAALGGPLARLGPLDSRDLVQLAYEKGLYVLAATQPDGVAKEVTQFKHGLLTYAFAVEGLQQRRAFVGRADGAITAEDAMIYAASRLGVLQKGHMQWAATRGEQAAYLPGEQGKPVEDRSIQRPRLFYPNDPEQVALVLSAAP